MVFRFGVFSLLRISPSQDFHWKIECFSPDIMASDLKAEAPQNMAASRDVTEVALQRGVDESLSSEEAPKALQKFTLAEIRSHNTPEDAWIVVDGNVYDVTEFLDCHPGGAEIILEHVGENDMGPIMRGSKDWDSHQHSKVAFKMLSQFLIGTVESSSRGDEKGSIDSVKVKQSSTSPESHFEVDLTKPLAFQVGHLGKRYQEWVHDPIVCKESPRFFHSDIAELLTTTKWWIIPIVFLPFVFWMEKAVLMAGYSLRYLSILMLEGALIWTLLEYLIHRFIFHMKSETYWWNTIHYLSHGFHHKHPMDGSRLVFPPVLTSIVCLLIWYAANIIPVTYLTKKALYGGGLLAYVIYDLTHYYLHFGVPFNERLHQLKRYHLNHHFKVQTDAFGITSSLWDWVFATLPNADAHTSMSER